MTENEKLTALVKNRIENMGVPASWFERALGIAYMTLQSRLKTNNWRKSEMALLKQIFKDGQ